jgi:hypothetical protein
MDAASFQMRPWTDVSMIICCKSNHDDEDGVVVAVSLATMEVAAVEVVDVWLLLLR